MVQLRTVAPRRGGPLDTPPDGPEVAQGRKAERLFTERLRPLAALYGSMPAHYLPAPAGGGRAAQARAAPRPGQDGTWPPSPAEASPPGAVPVLVFQTSRKLSGSRNTRFGPCASSFLRALQSDVPTRWFREKHHFTTPPTTPPPPPPRFGAGDPPPRLMPRSTSLHGRGPRYPAALPRRPPPADTRPQGRLGHGARARCGKETGKKQRGVSQGLDSQCISWPIMRRAPSSRRGRVGGGRE